MNALYTLDDSPWFEWIEMETIDSTNNFLKSYRPVRPKEMTLVSTDFQTAGRGQANNKWEAEAGKNVIYGILIHPQFLTVNRQFAISQIAALSAKEALEDYTDQLSIKWPNDIYWKDRKIGGMLIENTLCGKSIESSIVGIGLNINQEEFKSDAPNPVSLIQIIGHETERIFVLARAVERFKHYYQKLRNGEEELIARLYMQALYRNDGFYPYTDSNGQFEARIAGVEPTGHLLLQDTAGEIRRYAFKEVRYLIPDTHHHLNTL